MSRIWDTYWGGWLCRLLGHRWPPVRLSHSGNPRMIYVGCPRCRMNLERT